MSMWGHIGHGWMSACVSIKGEIQHFGKYAYST